MADDCLFCKMVSGEVECHKVYEDEEVMAFRDINPQAPVHILVIPKKHIPDASAITYMNSCMVARCFEAIPRIAKANHLEGGFRVVTNAGEDAGQTVPHLHFHLLGGERLSDKMS